MASHSSASRLVIECLKQAAKGEYLEKIFVRNPEVIDEVVFYDIVVIKDNLRWCITKRFDEFFRLNEELEKRVRNPDALPPFPSKQFKILTDHLNDNFIEMRRSLIENYMQKLLNIRRVRNCSLVLRFLAPTNEHSVEQISFKDSIFEADKVKQSTASPALVDNDDVPSSDNDNNNTNTEPKVSGAASPVKQTGNKKISDIFNNDEKATSASEEVTNVHVRCAQIVRNDHVVYQIDVENVYRRASFAKWTVLKRYQDFFTLDAKLRAKYETNEAMLKKLPILPERKFKFAINHLQRRFIEERRITLDVYCKALIRIPEVVDMDEILEFLSCL